MLPWKLRKNQILPVTQNLSSVYFSLAKFQLVSWNLSLAMIWQMKYTHKLPKLCSATLQHPHSQNREFNLINKNREEKSLRHVTMVAKLLDLNKAWSCKYGRKKKPKQKRKNLACMTTPVLDCTQEQNGSPYFPSMARQRKWPSLSWQIVEIQKSCYHGNVTSQFSSLRSTASIINCWKNI